MLDFKYKFIIPNKEFTDIVEEELTVHQEIEEKDVFFWVTIPKYIYEKVTDTDERYIVTRPEDFFIKDRIVRFKNIIKSYYFRELLTEMDKIRNDAIQVQRIIESQKSKVILIKFEKSEKNDVDKWQHAPMGLRIESRFQFFVAYERKNDVDRYGFLLTDKTSNRGIVYESLEQDTFGNQKKGYGFKRYWNNPTDDGFQVIKWTIEREQFFLHIQEQFVLLNNKLQDFLGSISDEKVNELMLKYKKGFYLESKEEMK